MKTFIVLSSSLLLFEILNSFFFRFEVSPSIFEPKNNTYQLKREAESNFLFNKEFKKIFIRNSKRTCFAKRDRPHNRVVHLVGDSQVFGWGLNSNETISCRLSKLLGEDVLVINHGVPGYGPNEFLRIVKNIQLAENDSIYLFFSEMNDLWDLYQKETSQSVYCDKLRNNRLDLLPCFVTSSFSFELLIKLFSGQRKLVALPLMFDQYSDVATSVLKYRLGNITDTFKEKKVHFVTIPWDGRYKKAESIKVFPNYRSIKFRDIYESDYKIKWTLSDFLFDGHLSPSGTKKVASAIKDNLWKK